jgi:hypothetical protein
MQNLAVSIAFTLVVVLLGTVTAGVIYLNVANALDKQQVCDRDARGHWRVTSARHSNAAAGYSELLRQAMPLLGRLRVQAGSH